MPPPSLVLRIQLHSGRHDVPIYNQPVVIGSGCDGTGCIHHPSLAARHAEVQLFGRGKYATIRRLDPAAKVEVNGLPTEDAIIGTESQIRLGGLDATLRISSEADSGMSAPEARSPQTPLFSSHDCGEPGKTHDLTASLSAEDLPSRLSANHGALPRESDGDWPLPSLSGLGLHGIKVSTTPLGQGGYGAVFLGRDNRLGRDIALKWIRPTRVRSFESIDAATVEARCLVEASGHPNIVEVFRLWVPGIDDAVSETLIEMQYMRGGSAIRWLERDHAPEIVVRGLLPIAGAIDWLHNRQLPLLHLDIKPGNILFDAEYSAAKLADFGVARLLRADGHDSPAPYGTPGFLPPEAFSCNAPDARTDLYLFAGTLYWCLTRHPPHDSSKQITSLLSDRRYVSSNIADAAALNPAVDASLSAILGRALAPDPDARFQSAADLYNDLRSWLHRREAAGLADVSGFIHEERTARRTRRVLANPLNPTVQRDVTRESEIDFKELGFAWDDVTRGRFWVGESSGDAFPVATAQLAGGAASEFCAAVSANILHTGAARAFDPVAPSSFPRRILGNTPQRADLSAPWLDHCLVHSGWPRARAPIPAPWNSWLRATHRAERIEFPDRRLVVLIATAWALRFYRGALPGSGEFSAGALDDLRNLATRDLPFAPKVVLVSLGVVGGVALDVAGRSGNPSGLVSIFQSQWGDAVRCWTPLPLPGILTPEDAALADLLSPVSAEADRERLAEFAAKHLRTAEFCHLPEAAAQLNMRLERANAAAEILARRGMFRLVPCPSGQLALAHL
jgi:serine/threonine protein kinase